MTVAPRFDTVLFDLAGTLFSQRALGPPFRAMLADLARAAGIDVDDGGVRAAYRTGITESFLGVDGDYYLHSDLFAGAFRGYLTAIGATATDEVVGEAVAAQRALTIREAEPRPGMHDTLARLRKAGVHVGVVSNMDDDYFEPLLDKLGLRDVIDGALSSEGALSCKPHRAIYDRALATAGGHEPERAVFVGDTPSADIAGPRRLGFTTVLILEEGHTRRPPRVEDETPHHVITALPDLLPIVGIEPWCPTP